MSIIARKINWLEDMKQHLVWDLDEQIDQVIQSAWPEYDPGIHFVQTFWECDYSPFGFCAYHDFEDPAHDSCIFCMEPYERK